MKVDSDLNSLNLSYKNSQIEKKFGKAISDDESVYIFWTLGIIQADLIH